MGNRKKPKKSETEQSALAALSEDELRQTILIPLFEAMKFRDVRHHHGGPQELGKDITMWKPDDLDERVNYAVVAKKGDITGSAAGKQGAGEVGTQIRQCFGAPFLDAVTMEEQEVGRCWVVASGKISKEAKTAIKAALKDTNLGRLVRFIDGKQLDQLVAKHLPGKTLWDHVDAVRDTAMQVDEHYNISLGVGPDKTTINLLPKDPSAKPPPLEIKFEIPPGPQTAEARKDFETFLKKGGPLKLDPKHLANIQLPNVMKKLMGSKDLVALGFVPEISKPVAFRFICEPDEGKRAVLERIEMRCTRAGTEEVALTNEDQEYPAIIEMVMHRQDKRLNVQFTPRPLGYNVASVAEWLRFQRSSSKPGAHIIEVVQTGALFARHRTSNVLPPPNEAVLEIAEALAFIQRKTYAMFNLPERISGEEQGNILRMVELIKTGLQNVESISVTLADDPQRPPITSQKTGEFHFQNQEDQFQTILGIPVNLGPVELHCAAAEITPTDKERQIIIRPTEAESFEMSYPKWLPKSE